MLRALATVVSTTSISLGYQMVLKTELFQSFNHLVCGNSLILQAHDRLREGIRKEYFTVR